MDKNIQQILTELYELEPQLKNHEEQLIKTIQKLLAAKPDTRFDQQFAKQLRAQLAQADSATTVNLFNVNFMQKFGYLIGGAVIASLLIVPVVLTKFGGQTGFDFNAAPEISLIGEQAFGSLAGQLAQGTPTAAPEVSRSMAFDAYQGQAGMDAKVAATAPNAVRPQSGGGGTASAGSAMVINPDGGPYHITQFKYNYTGTDFSLDADKLEVLHQMPPRPTAGSLASTLSLGLIGSNQVSGLKLENVSLSQGTTDGIRMYTDFINGEVSISQDSGYAMPEGDYRPLTPNEVPADADLIKIADAFVKRFGIKLDGFGAPEVSQQNRYAIELYARQTADAYIPDIFTVVYPLVVKDLPVYDQGGSKAGIMVSINLRTKKAVAISGLNLQKYEASLYPVQGDIGALLEKYQAQNNYAYDGNYIVDTVDVNLNTPELVFMIMFTYNNNQSQKLLVPAYRFSVLEKPADQPWFADNIIIPLVSGLQGDGGPIRIMPMGEPLMMKTDPGVSVSVPTPATQPNVY